MLLKPKISVLVENEVSHYDDAHSPLISLLVFPKNKKKNSQIKNSLLGLHIYEEAKNKADVPLATFPWRSWLEYSQSTLCLS
jgi:hypothetical protein